MAKGHQKIGSGGAFGHSGQPEAGYSIRGRQAGGKLHRAGAKKLAKPAEVSTIVAKAMVAHVEKQEAALEDKVSAAIARAETMIAENRAAVAAAKMAQLEAIRYVPFQSAAEGARERLVAQGLVR